MAPLLGWQAQMVTSELMDEVEELLGRDAGAPSTRNEIATLDVSARVHHRSMPTSSRGILVARQRQVD